MFSGFFKRKKEAPDKSDARPVTAATGRVPFKVREDDVFIVSYPKSGNTWVRFLVGNYITENKLDFINSNDFIPDMHAHPEKCEALTGQRIMKSHFDFTPEFKNVIYVVRDGRDVAVSYYYFYLKYVFNKENAKPNFHEYSKLFLEGGIAFGRWDRHVNSWLDKHPERFLLLRYEDIMDNTEKALKDILLFIYGTYDEERIKKAVEASRFERMAEQEREQRMKLPRNAASDSSIAFVRKGKPGNYNEYFTEEGLASFRKTFGETMNRLGYKI